MGNYINIITVLQTMKIEYDKEVDAAYIYLKDTIKESEVKKSVELKENIIFDYDNGGKLIGVEILDASKVLNKEVLLKAQEA